MSRFNFYYFLIFIFSLITMLTLSPMVQAQEEPEEINQSEEQLPTAPKKVTLKTVSFSYLSWTEFLSLDNGTSADEAYASFYGTALTYEKESYRNRKGTLVSGSLILGQANGGGTQTGITYQKANQKWLGLMAEYKYAYRLTQQITMAGGPLVLFRQIDWEKPAGITEVKSGAQINLGAMLDLRIRFNPRWELRQTFGTMAFKASTIWSVGMGYKF